MTPADTKETRMRPAYHFSVPDNWKNDPQRPIFLNGEYHYYYLYNADYLAGGPGTAWRRAVTRDHVTFRDAGIAIPKNTNANGDCWSGSLVVDERNTSGYGAGAVIAIVTQAPQGRQAQYLWYSTDGGRTFAAGGDAPVLSNPGVPDFRDPKVMWDAARDRWFMVNAEGHRLGFYASSDLRSWQPVGGFARDDLGLLECPDIFQMTAGDGTLHWVLAASANGKARGLPATYAYWTGIFDGASFEPDRNEPEWLDYGFDFYGAVTYPHYDEAGKEDDSLRHVIGWANFWDYPNNTPTLVSDGYNGDDMIVRDVRLVRGDDSYYLASSPTASLESYGRRSREMSDIDVTGFHDLEDEVSTYDFSCDIFWNPSAPPAEVGLQVSRAPGGGRFVEIGVNPKESSVYADRRWTISPTAGRTVTVTDLEPGHARLRVLVDRTSVEMFVDNGRVVHSHRVFPLTGDSRIRLFCRDGTASFRNLEVRELSETSMARMDTAINL